MMAKRAKAALDNAYVIYGIAPADESQLIAPRLLANRLKWPVQYASGGTLGPMSIWVRGRGPWDGIAMQRGTPPQLERVLIVLLIARWFHSDENGEPCCSADFYPCVFCQETAQFLLAMPIPFGALLAEVGPDALLLSQALGVPSHVAASRLLLHTVLQEGGPAPPRTQRGPPSAPLAPAKSPPRGVTGAYRIAETGITLASVPAGVRAKKAQNGI